MSQSINPRTHLLLSIAFSHYNEKARWAFAYYGILYTHHLLLPGFHVFSVKPAAEGRTTSAEIRGSNARTSPYSTPCLVVYGDNLRDVQESLHESHDILRYLSDHFSTPERVSLYRSCGATREDQINALEKHYDEVLGQAARRYIYCDMLVLNKWRALVPFALLGFKNRVGTLQSILWLILSPLLGPLLISAMKCTAKSHEAAMQTCRVEFEHASQLLQKSPYLAGECLSAADITFAALSYPVLGVTHEEGYQQYPPSSSAFSSPGKDFQKELRATLAGQHVLRLFKEERGFGTPLPLQKRTLLGLW